MLLKSVLLKSWSTESSSPESGGDSPFEHVSTQSQKVTPFKLRKTTPQALYEQLNRIVSTHTHTQVLMDMFYQGDSSSSMAPSQLPPTPRTSLSYEEVVKELIHDEKQYQRDLHMIIRVFREELVKIVRDPKVVMRSDEFGPGFSLTACPFLGAGLDFLQHYGYLRGIRDAARIARGCHRNVAGANSSVHR